MPQVFVALSNSETQIIPEAKDWIILSFWPDVQYTKLTCMYSFAVTKTSLNNSIVILYFFFFYIQVVICQTFT